MKSFILAASLLIPTGAAIASDKCNYTSEAGKEFVFPEATESLQQYGYLGWKNRMSDNSKTLTYRHYHGKHGKLQEQKIEDRFTYWFVAVLENCEKVYTSGGTRSRPKDINEIEKFGGIYFLETLAKAESMIGRSVWMNLNGSAVEKTLFTDDSSTTYSLNHLEPVQIVDIQTRRIGHARGAGPFYLRVQKTNGEQGYVAFNDRYFFSEAPIDPTWDEQLIEAIKQRKIRIGMTEQQLLLSWGKPDKVNSTVGAYGVHEQWVYGQSQYVYMKNGKLDSFQSSR